MGKRAGRPRRAGRDGPASRGGVGDRGTAGGEAALPADEPVSKSYLNWNLQRHGVSIERIRRDRVLHEALTARADPLHLALVFGLSHTTAASLAHGPPSSLDGYEAATCVDNPSLAI